MQLCLETNEKMTLQDLFILLRVTVLTWQLKCYGHGLVSTAKPELQHKVWMLAKIKFKKTQNFDTEVVADEWGKIRHRWFP